MSAFCSLSFSFRLPLIRFLKVPKTFRARKAISKTAIRLKSWSFTVTSRYERANLLQNLMPGNAFVFKIYVGTYGTQNKPEKFREFRETKMVLLCAWTASERRRENKKQQRRTQLEKTDKAKLAAMHTAYFHLYSQRSAPNSSTGLSVVYF